MKARTDPQLLRAYAESRSEASFAELVRRHIDLVHSATLRMVNDPHLAKDVTQGVFVALAKDAAKLMDHPVLSGWLHRTARNIAAQTIRTEVRRRTRDHLNSKKTLLIRMWSCLPPECWYKCSMTVLAELRELPLHEKLRMMEALWDDIAPLEAELEVPQWHKEILDERERLVQEGKATFIEWETAKQQITDAIS